MNLMLGSLLLSCGVAAGSADVPSTQPAQPTDACPLVFPVPVPESLKWTVQRDLDLKSHPDSAKGYCDLIRDIISLNWNPWETPAMQTGETVNVVAFFTIGRSGDLGHVISVEASTGDPLFAESAVAAIRRSGPFPRVPAHLTEETLRVSVGFASTERRDESPR